MSVFGLKLEYSVNGVDDEFALQRMTVAFERAGSEVAKLGTYIYPRLVPVFEAELERQFDAEGQGPNRGAWAELSKAYEEWKAGRYPGQPILQATGRMKEALTSSGSPFAQRVYNDSTFEFGTQGLDYPSHHQGGTERMPDRPPYDFGAELEQQLRTESLAGVREALAASRANEFLTEGGGL